MSNVVDLPVITRLPLDPKRVLAGASEVDFKRVLIIGVTDDDEEYFYCSDPDGGTCIWDMERAKLKLLRVAD